MKRKSQAVRDEARTEYEFDYANATRGKYHRLLMKEGANVVILEPDVAKAFRTSAAVNTALRSLLEVSAVTRRLTARSSAKPRGRRASDSQ